MLQRFVGAQDDGLLSLMLHTCCEKAMIPANNGLLLQRTEFLLALRRLTRER